MRPNYWTRFIGVSDPRQGALSDMYTLRRQFLESKGIKETEMLVWQTDKTFSNMRKAAETHNLEAFKEAKRAYLETKTASGKLRNYKTFKASLRYLDPIASRLKKSDEKEFEFQFLTPPQKEKLKMVRDYAGELGDTMWNYWQQAIIDESVQKAKAK